ncbi:MAG: hypothetical protein ACLT98_10850 [Eggerthellaceae bacterium]
MTEGGSRTPRCGGATTSWPRRWGGPHAWLRLRAGLRAVRAGAAGGGLRVPRGSALRLLRGLRGRPVRAEAFARSGFRRGLIGEMIIASQLEGSSSWPQVGRCVVCGAGPDELAAGQVKVGRDHQRGRRISPR